MIELKKVTERKAPITKSSKAVEKKVYIFKPNNTVSQTMRMVNEVLDGKGDLISALEVLHAQAQVFNSRSQARPMELRKAHQELHKMAKVLV